MNLLKFFLKLFSGVSTRKSDYFIYRISNYDNFIIKFQCINSRVEFSLHLESIIRRKDVLYRLNPLNSCFLGLEYEKYSQLNNIKKSDEIITKTEYDFLLYRYGKYKMQGKNNRTGNIIFINQENNEEMSMSPIEIVKTNELIKEFDAAQAFAIGVEAAYLQSRAEKNKNDSFNKVCHLKLAEPVLNLYEERQNSNDTKYSIEDMTTKLKIIN